MAAWLAPVDGVAAWLAPVDGVAGPAGSADGRSAAAAATLGGATAERRPALPGVVREVLPSDCRMLCWRLVNWSDRACRCSVVKPEAVACRARAPSCRSLGTSWSAVAASWVAAFMAVWDRLVRDARERNSVPRLLVWRVCAASRTGAGTEVLAALGAGERVARRTDWSSVWSAGLMVDMAASSRSAPLGHPAGRGLAARESAHLHPGSPTLLGDRNAANLGPRVHPTRVHTTYNVIPGVHFARPFSAAGRGQAARRGAMFCITMLDFR